MPSNQGDRKAVLARLPIATQRQTSDLHCHPSLQDCVRASLPQTCGRPTLHWPTPQCRRTKEKRSKPVRYTKVPLTRFGSVLRGTKRPSELHLCQLHCETLPSGLRRSSQRLAVVPRRAPRIKGIAVAVSSRLFRSLSLATQPPAHCAGLSPTAPRGHNRPGTVVPARPSVPRIRVH